MTQCLGTPVPVKAKHFNVHPGVARTVCVVAWLPLLAWVFTRHASVFVPHCVHSSALPHTPRVSQSQTLSTVYASVQPFITPQLTAFWLHAGLTNVLLAVQASGSFLTVTASTLLISRKRKRDSDSRCNDFTTLTATNEADAQMLPASTCTATSSAPDDKTSAPQTGTCASPADTLTASSPKIGSPPSPAAPPFPLEHYEATIAQMQAANYPLPVSATGQKFLPLGFVASYDSGEAHADAAGCLYAYHPDANTYMKIGQQSSCI